MKSILIIGHTALKQALKAQGFQVYTTGSMEPAKDHYDLFYEKITPLGKILDDLAKKQVFPDCILYHDDGNLPWVVGLEAREIPAIYYSVDTFCNPWHIPFSKIFDYTLVAQKDFLNLFLEHKVQAIWFPLFCASSLMCEFTEEDFLNRQIPVSFVGTLKPKNIPQREAFLLNFKKNCPLVVKQGNFTPIFSQSQIVLNQSAASEINYRVFEATALGATLLNEKINQGLESLYTEGKDILPMYTKDNFLEAAHIAQSYLKDSKVLGEVAFNGWNKTKTFHTDIQRAQKVAKLFFAFYGKIPTILEKEQRKAQVENAFQILACELINTWPEHGIFYRDYKSL